MPMNMKHLNINYMFWCGLNLWYEWMMVILGSWIKDFSVMSMTGRWISSIWGFFSDFFVPSSHAIRRLVFAKIVRESPHLNIYILVVKKRNLWFRSWNWKLLTINRNSFVIFRSIGNQSHGFPGHILYKWGTVNPHTKTNENTDLCSAQHFTKPQSASHPPPSASVTHWIMCVFIHLSAMHILRWFRQNACVNAE